MSLRDRLPGDDEEVDLDRRRAMKYAAGGGLALGGAKAVDNVVLGYGVVVGTNLRDQDLAALARERLGPAVRYVVDAGDRRLTLWEGEMLDVYDGAGQRLQHHRLAGLGPEEAAAIDADLPHDGKPVSQLAADVGELRAGEVPFEFYQYEEFFERVRAAESRPYTVGALRGTTPNEPAPGTVEAFAGAAPTEPEAVLEGLVGGFRSHTSYDLPRYVAGSIEDNVLFGLVDLRQHFESPADFEALAAGRTSGMFCFEFTDRSMEALHAVPAHRQRAPVVAATVVDSRHKHVYTGVASVVRDAGGDLAVPMTFVDYTHSTLYDDLHLTWLLGRGLAAYDGRHRATDVYWNA